MCFLQITSNAIGGTWSSTLFGWNCYDDVTFSGKLACNDKQTTDPISIINSDPAQTKWLNMLVLSIPG